MEFKALGTYSLLITLSDGYALPSQFQMGLTIDDPLTSKRTKGGKGLKDETNFSGDSIQ
jgi:hypothetical protein